MTPFRFAAFAHLTVLALGLTPAATDADLIFTVSMNTTPLIGHPAGPFSLDFQLNNGSGPLGDNTAVISNFNFGGGSPAGSPNLVGGATGDLSSAVTLTDGFPGEFYQEFNPGATLSFQVALTTNVDTPIPDQFSFAILDSSLAEVPTQAPGGLDVFLLVDITSSRPTVQTFGSDPGVPPVAGGGPLAIAAPQVLVIPEPGTLTVFALGLAGAALCRRRRSAPGTAC